MKKISRTLVKTLCAGSLICLLHALSAGGADEPQQKEWAREDTERTIAAIKASPYLEEYSRLERGEYAQWKAKNAARDRDVLGKGAVLHSGWVYQFHEPQAQSTWVWRRARAESFISQKTNWETLATFQKPIGKTESAEPTAECFRERCLVRVPDSSSTETVWREFDLRARRFLDDGFVLREKNISQVEWESTDNLIIKQEQGSADTGSTEVIVRRTRGRLFQDAKVLFEEKSSDGSLYLQGLRDGDREPIVLISRTDAKNEDRRRQAQNLGKQAPLVPHATYWRVRQDGTLVALDIPPDAWIAAVHQGQYILRRTAYGGRSYGVPDDWVVGGKRWPRGSILSVPVEARSLGEVRLLAAPYPGQSEHVPIFKTSECVVVRTTEYTRPRLRCYRLKDSKWIPTEIKFPVEYSWSVADTTSDPTSSIAFTTYENMVEPKTLFAVDTKRGRAIDAPGRSLLPFDAANKYVMHRFEAVSQDGTKVPYFVAHAKDLKLDGGNATLMWFYGGWGVPELPAYGRYCEPGFWLERGAVCVLASIRGGTEMGNEWHVRGPERRHVYNDIVAVAEDLVRRRITSPRHLGMFGHYKYGGLAVAVVAQMRPDLFNAGVVEVGILDVLDPSIRDDYELGSPEVPAERAYLESTSPVQALKKNGRAWPVLVLTAAGSDLDAMAERYATRSKALGLPYDVYDFKHGDADQVPALAAFYTYLADHLRPSR